MMAIFRCSLSEAASFKSWYAPFDLSGRELKIFYPILCDIIHLLHGLYCMCETASELIREKIFFYKLLE